MTENRYEPGYTNSTCISNALDCSTVVSFLQCSPILTQAILRRNQNSFCLFICICTTPASAVRMSVTAVSNFGNRSTMRRLHTVIVLWERRTGRDEDGGRWRTRNEPRFVGPRALKLPQVGVQVFHHPVLVLNHLQNDLQHVRTVAVATRRVRTCTSTRKHPITLITASWLILLHQPNLYNARLCSQKGI